MSSTRSWGMWVLCATLLSAGCGGESAVSGGHPDVERMVVGDTMVVRNYSALGAWGDTMVLVPEIRIGSLDGPPEQIFGNITSVAVRPNGNILVLDTQVPAVREFDAEGRYLRTLGRRGQGPGEFERPMAIRLDRTGRLLVLDWNRRMTVFGVDGRPEKSWMLDGAYPNYDFTIDTVGNTYVLIGMPPPPGTPTGATPLEPGRWIAYQRYSPDGVPGDTIPPGGWVLDRPGRTRASVTVGSRTADNFTGLGFAVVHPFGWLMTGLSDRYAITLTPPWNLPGGALREADSDSPEILRIERVVDPAPIEDAEWDQWQAYIDARQKRLHEQVENIRATQHVDITEPPRPYLPESRTKPYLRWPTFGQDGRVWVQRYTVAVEQPPRERATPPPGAPPPLPEVTWSEPQIDDVFDMDGTFLGAVAVPDGYSLYRRDGDHVWGVTRDDLDVQYVVRARLVPKRSLGHPEG